MYCRRYLVLSRFYQGKRLQISISLLLCYVRCGSLRREEKSLQKKNNKMRDAAGERLLSFWQKLNREGVDFFVDGEIVRPRDAYSKAVREDSTYMTDYVWGEQGKLTQIRLDKVDPE